MNILAIDPGTTQSAWCQLQGDQIYRCGIQPNERVKEIVSTEARCGWQVAIEMVACYGMPVGAEVFETCLWIGRYLEVAGVAGLVYRKQVCMHLCGSARAKDPNIRQALLDLFPRAGGGKTPQVGTKAKPGPLYGVKDDIWAALGVAITYRDLQRVAA